MWPLEVTLVLLEQFDSAISCPQAAQFGIRRRFAAAPKDTEAVLLNAATLISTNWSSGAGSK